MSACVAQLPLACRLTRRGGGGAPQALRRKCDRAAAAVVTYHHQHIIFSVSNCSGHTRLAGRTTTQQACHSAAALILPVQVESGFLYSILWLKRMVLMTLGEVRLRRRRREPLASSSRGESQSLKCVRELLYPHADGTLLLPTHSATPSSAMNRLSSVLGCYAIPSFRSYPPPTHSQ